MVKELNDYSKSSAKNFPIEIGNYFYNHLLIVIGSIHYNYFILDSNIDRDKLANKLYLSGIENANAYDPPCHKQEIYKDYLQKKPYEISDDIMKRHLSLPMYCELTEKDIEYIVNKLVESIEELNDSN